MSVSKSDLIKQLKKIYPNLLKKDLLKIFDIFIHIPKLGDKEAFGQTYVEALLLKTPCIFSNTGVAKEFTNHEQNIHEKRKNIVSIPGTYKR